MLIQHLLLIEQFNYNEGEFNDAKKQFYLNLEPCFILVTNVSNAPLFFYRRADVHLIMRNIDVGRQQQVLEDPFSETSPPRLLSIKINELRNFQLLGMVSYSMSIITTSTYMPSSRAWLSCPNHWQQQHNHRIFTLQQNYKS